MNNIKYVFFAFYIIISVPESSFAVERFEYPKVIEDSSGNLVLQSSNVRVVAVSEEKGYSSVKFYGLSENKWHLAGALFPISDVSASKENNTEILSTEIIPSGANHLINKFSKSGISLYSNLKNDLGLDLEYNLTLAVSEDDYGIDATTTLKANENINLYRFGAINLKAGEGSFGDDKNQALYPGLEWLVAGETSSSTMDIYPPNNIRFAPDPRWVTIPAMGVLSDASMLVGILWEATQEWSAGCKMPTSVFASPNFLNNQDNHRMDLFVPSLPDYVNANAIAASTPFKMNKDDEVQVVSRIIIDASADDMLTLVDHWLDMHGGFPSPAPLPRTVEEEFELSRRAYLNTLWEDSCKCWYPVIDYSTCAHLPSFAYILWLDYKHTGSFNAKNRYTEAITEYLQKDPPGSMLGEVSGEYSWPAPFVFGDWAPSIHKYIYSVSSNLSRQREDGSFPSYLGVPDLGDQEIRVLCPTAKKACLLLQLGRQTKNNDFLSSGKLALDHIKQFVVPRGAQTWEIPQHSPDILASAYAVKAYVAAYEAFRDIEYLEKAIYWARTGFPFLWLWNPENQEVMRYGSVAVYGATGFSYSWLGLEVQWTGLAYAHALFELNKYDSTYPWFKIASGITISAMYQQQTGGELDGTYPDAWNTVTNQPQPFYINPENIIKDLVFMLGDNPEVETIQIGSTNVMDENTIIVTGRVNSFEEDLFVPGKCVSFSVGNAIGETSRLLLAGWDESPETSILKGNVLLPKVADIDSASEGYQFMDNCCLIRIIHNNEKETISLGYNIKPAIWKIY